MQIFKKFTSSQKNYCSVQALDTMGKIKEMNEYVRVTLDKLQGIRAALVRNDDNWQDWKFQQLVEALEKWTLRNPIPLSDKQNPEKDNSYRKSYQANQTKSECVYCEKPDHRPLECKTTKTVTERRKILSNKKLCFICTRAKHRVAECRSARTCLIYKNKHHASIYDKFADSKSTETNVTYAVAIIKVNGIKCRALLDRGSGSSYISESFIDLLKINAVGKEHKTIETLTKSTTKNLKYIT